ncbi:MAG TPA: hypothetical protein PLX89_03100 [Verrucomicrobiota bacterium]|nr:hypothetical protein [Verrucomicrobiales bacterium]HRI11969.1 hypothetical protein [Verrucomicrobiota bacterium]
MTTDAQPESTSQKWRRVLIREFFEYLYNFAFLAFFLVAFAWYRRLILAAYHIQYIGYWAPLVEAAILAKVVMIGDVLRMGRRFRNRPLVVPTIYRTFVFTLLVVLFSFGEHIVGALIHGRPAADGIAEIANKGKDEVLAWCVLIFVAFLPFFTVKEIECAFGAEKVRGLFFRGRVDETHSPGEGKSNTAAKLSSKL